MVYSIQFPNCLVKRGSTKPKMKNQKFKDDMGHTLILKSEEEVIICLCPFCNDMKIFDYCSPLNKTGGKKQNKV